jgi:hypothetical protein
VGEVQILRKALVALVSTAVVGVLLLPAPAVTAASAAAGSAQGSDSPIASQSKKKCKKKKRKCKKRGQTGSPWLSGRYSGSYAENAIELRFNVVGARLYTGAFDSFFIYADCGGGNFDPSAIAPVQASIAGNGVFSGSGVYSPGFGQQIPWQISGRIAGGSVTNGIFSAGPYVDFFGNQCSGTTHFTAQWFANYTL